MVLEVSGGDRWCFHHYLASKETHLPRDRFQQNGKNARLVVMENMGTNLELCPCVNILLPAKQRSS